MIEQTYWLGRKRSAMTMALKAATSTSRLIHYDLAGRYSIKAALCPPFMLPRSAPSSEGERAVLQIPLPRPGKPRRPPTIGDSSNPQGERR